MNNRNMTKWQSVLLLFILWIIPTFCNIGKPYHIDDTVHLETAEWIAKNPTKPMSGNINWANSSEPIHKLNQPHLYFYLLGFYMKIFGKHENVTHLFQSFFTLMSILFFYYLSKLHLKDRIIFPLLFFIFCPAFIVGQNLMVDVPVLSLWILFYYILTINTNTSKFYKYLAASLIVSASILTKYTSLILIPSLFLGIILRNDFKYIYIVIIPIVVLFLWSLFNIYDYGAIHILDRPTREFSLLRSGNVGLSWIVCIGSITPFSLAVLSGFIEKYNFRYPSIIYKFLLFITSFSIFTYILFIFDILNEYKTDIFLRYLFLINGLVVVSGILYIIVFHLKNFHNMKIEEVHGDILLLFWFFSGLLFVVFFAPFMATRHVLLIIPPVIILLNKHMMCQARKNFLYLSVLLSIFISLMLAASDFSFANFYKKNAVLIASKLEDKKAWFSGHWGWQWYARESGMDQIDSNNISSVKPGDYLVYPENIHQQAGILDSLSVELILEIKEDKMWWDYISTDGPARFYKSDYPKIPWNYSKTPYGPIKIYKVIEVNSSNKAAAY